MFGLRRQNEQFPKERRELTPVSVSLGSKRAIVTFLLIMGAAALLLMILRFVLH
jgi:hypothetical protein